MTHQHNMATKIRVLILGAAGRDFHNFNVAFRNDERYTVVGFTATQIPRIEGRTYPPSLSGPLYPNGLPIWSEDDLEEIVKRERVETCILSYSDLPNKTVMNIGHRVMATGCNFQLLGPEATMLKSNKPVIAICAVRTGCGKSQTSRYVAKLLKDAGLRTVAIRHPMPYGNLAKQAVQRFATYEDMARHNVTIEEREEYEMHVANDIVVYAGVDYEPILRQAEQESDVIIWDGGNNDFPFYKPDFWITVADPLRPNHEVDYYPGSVNFRCADVILINKANTAPAEAVEVIKANAARLNPRAQVILGCSEVATETPEAIRGKRVLIIDDGPTLTHGEMAFGAGTVAAQKYGAAEIIDPRPFAIGSLVKLFEKFMHLGNTLPAMGYYPEQIQEMEETVRRSECDAVVIATPMDLSRLITIEKPYAVVSYDLFDMEGPVLRNPVNAWIESVKAQQKH
eukprot:gnl/Trimastix_PCT/87.p2 GENE.gnl/Trimastix_PCT/87~~gnl/Trimastix_PCT/87.p2  ORF type:complete len:471 (+),score=154.34 gnl/Trimastix_PCT/87:54-1415(+)